MYINLGERLNNEFYGDNVFKEIANTYIQSLYDANYDGVEITYTNFCNETVYKHNKNDVFFEFKVKETLQGIRGIISVIFNDKKIFQYETNKKETKFILDCDAFVKCDWILKKVAP